MPNNLTRTRDEKGDLRHQYCCNNISGLTSPLSALYAGKKLLVRKASRVKIAEMNIEVADAEGDWSHCIAPYSCTNIHLSPLPDHNVPHKKGWMRRDGCSSRKKLFFP